jgi:glycosyltransferase involved in cell wall biosynthesis
MKFQYTVAEISPGTFTVPPKGYGGVERMLFSLANSIYTEVRTTIIDFDKAEFRAIEGGVERIVIKNPFKLCRFRGLSVYSWNAMTSAFLLFLYYVRHKMYRKRLVLHFHNGVQFAFFRLAERLLFGSKNVQYVYSHHSPRWMNPRLLKMWEKMLAIPTELYSISHADLVTFESKAVFNAMFSYCRRLNNYTILPNGVDTDFFDQRNYSYTVEPYTIFYGARIKHQKDQLTVVRAFRKVLDAEPKAKLILLGDPEEMDYFSSVRSEVKRLGLSDHVKFIPSVDIITLNRYRLRFPINIVYSSYTGFDVAVGETMSLGVACVFSDIPTLDGIAKHGINCLLVPPGNADALASALLYLFSHPAEIQSLGKMARKTVEESLSWRVLSRNFLLALEKTLPDFYSPE